ncbi:MAG TPA: hypothetical protein VGV09_03875 [Steroidobacteraceae bacterium]|nr:hypothetical protein [Steroidobacteraceae bacterium]
MSDVRDEGAPARRSSYWREVGCAWLDLALVVVGSLALRFGLMRFAWFSSFHDNHAFWAELVPIWLVVISFMLFVRPRWRGAEDAAYREDLRRGRLKRMSLASRSAVLLVSLGLIVVGSIFRGPYQVVALAVGVPTLVLFALEEVNIVLRPGDSLVVRDRPDELVEFFKARSLQIGYLVAVLSLLCSYVVSLAAPRYASMLLSVVLVVSLLVPAHVYHRLDRRAGGDD